MDILSDVSVSGKLTAETAKVNNNLEARIIKATNNGLNGERSLQVDGHSIFNGNAEFCGLTFFDQNALFCQDVRICGESFFGENLKTIELGHLGYPGYKSNKAFTFKVDKNNNTTVVVTATEFYIDTSILSIHCMKVPVRRSIMLSVPANCSWFFVDSAHTIIYCSNSKYYDNVDSLLPITQVSESVTRNGTEFKKLVEADLYFGYSGCSDHGSSAYSNRPDLVNSLVNIYAKITPRDEVIDLYFNFLY